ncbi:unnamed protein product [Closterium sp. Naga37s-1]|nr:unnamed protein product [Closterium sp. Naga37s-1]
MARINESTNQRIELDDRVSISADFPAGSAISPATQARRRFIEDKGAGDNVAAERAEMLARVLAPSGDYLPRIKLGAAGGAEEASAGWSVRCTRMPTLPSHTPHASHAPHTFHEPLTLIHPFPSIPSALRFSYLSALTRSLPSPSFSTLFLTRTPLPHSHPSSSLSPLFRTHPSLTLTILPDSLPAGQFLLSLSPHLPSHYPVLGHYAVEEAPHNDLRPVMGDGSVQLRTAAARSFLSMQDAARRDGIFLTPLSGFRSVRDQQSVFYGVKAARNQNIRQRAKVSAPPGFSEHHTGYALDIGDANSPATHLEFGTIGDCWLTECMLVQHGL